MATVRPSLATRTTLLEAAVEVKKAGIEGVVEVAKAGIKGAVEVAKGGIDGVVEGSLPQVKSASKSTAELVLIPYATVLGAAASSTTRNAQQAMETLPEDISDLGGKAGVGLWEQMKSAANALDKVTDAAVGNVQQGFANITETVSERYADYKRDRAIENTTDPKLRQMAIDMREREERVEAEKREFMRRSDEAGIALKDADAGTIYALDGIDKSIFQNAQGSTFSKGRLADFRSAKSPQPQEPSSNAPAMK